MALKLSGPLNTHMEPRVIGLLMSESDVERKCASWAAEDMKNLRLLCAHLGIADGPHQYMTLSLTLARIVVPCFQVKTKEGRPKKWDDYTLGILAVELERIIGCGKTLDDAAKILASRKPWINFLESWDEGGSSFGAAPDEALKKAYKSSRKKKFTDVARDAFRYCEMTGTIPDWAKGVLAIKGNN